MGFPIKPLKAKLLAGEQKATDVCRGSFPASLARQTVSQESEDSEGKAERGFDQTRVADEGRATARRATWFGSKGIIAGTTSQVVGHEYPTINFMPTKGY